VSTEKSDGHFKQINTQKNYRKCDHEGASPKTSTTYGMKALNRISGRVNVGKIIA
jgi:hypothetical protein